MRLSTQHLHLESAQAPRKPQSKHNARSRPLAVSPDPRPAPSHPHKCHHHPPGCLVSRGLVRAHGRTGALPGFPAPGLPAPLAAPPAFPGAPRTHIRVQLGSACGRRVAGPAARRLGSHLLPRPASHSARPPWSPRGKNGLPAAPLPGDRPPRMRLLAESRVSQASPSPSPNHEASLTVTYWPEKTQLMLALDTYGDRSPKINGFAKGKQTKPDLVRITGRMTSRV